MEVKSTFGTQPKLMVSIEGWSLDTGGQGIESLIGKIKHDLMRLKSTNAMKGSCFVGRLSFSWRRYSTAVNCRFQDGCP